jgi:sugar fermentation stimulation protein A
LVSLDSTLPNRLIRKALAERALAEFAGWDLVRWEVTLGRSRFDFLLSDARGRQMVVEVKSVTLVENGVGLFPDAVTERGARHVRELAELAGQEGWEAAVLFVLQRSDASEIRAARAIDPKFAEALLEAEEAGVRILGRRCRVYNDQVELGDPIVAGVA